MSDTNAEYKLPVACFGTPGSYSYKAMTEFFSGKKLETTYHSQFEDLVQAVAAGKVRYGILPIENSSTGGITEVYDLIHRYDCSIVGEKYIKVEHDLVVLPGTSLSDIRIVYSHPQGLAQCRNYFKKHPDWILQPYFSTSQSAQRVQEEQRHDVAAIANSTAAELYGLDILARNVNDNVTNFTRFVIIARQLEEHENIDKITLVLTVNHSPGALYHVLGHFFYNDMNMTHLESRPIEGRPFEYFFHIDVMGSLKDPGVLRTLQTLARTCKYFKILGNYPSDKEGVIYETRPDRQKIEP